MGPAEVSSENRRSSGLLKKPLTGCSKRSRGEARMDRDRVCERDREIQTSTNTLHEHEFERGD
jgi:hypothetical protein